MAKGGGGKGGGGGKRTERSQRYAAARNDYLRQYGYPSMRELRREAQGLAGASVPTVRQTTRPYRNQIQSSKDYLEAVRAALAETQGQVGSDYSQAVGEAQQTDQAAQARLAALGLGTDQAGVQAAVGARGDSATQNLIANQASAGNYAAQLPAIASGQASQFADATRNKMLDALSNRRDALSQAFFQALQQVQSNALQRASFNQSSDQFNQQLAQSAHQFAASQAQSESQFEASQAQSASQFNAQMAYDYASLGARTGGTSGSKARNIASRLGLTPNEFQGKVAAAIQQLNGTPQDTTKVPVYGADGKIKGYKQVAVQGSGVPGAIQNGIPFHAAVIALAQQAGIDPRIATFAAAQVYKNAENTNYDAWRSFAEYMAQHGSARYQRVLSGHQPTQTRHPYGPHH